MTTKHTVWCISSGRICIEMYLWGHFLYWK